MLELRTRRRLLFGYLGNAILEKLDERRSQQQLDQATEMLDRVEKVFDKTFPVKRGSKYHVDIPIKIMPPKKGTNNKKQK